MSHRLKVYTSFGKLAFLEILTYRMRYVTGIITYLLFVSVNYFIWQAVFANRPAGVAIAGYTLDEMVTYVAIGWISRSFYFSNIDYDLNDLVKKGDIANYLLRPVDLQGMLFSRALGETVFRGVFFSLPISVVICAVYPVSLPQSFTAFILFLVSLSFAFVIMALINFLVGLSAFALKSVTGLMQAKYYIIQLCSGLLLPLTFFPDNVRLVLEYLPFAAFTYIPLRLYLGQTSGVDSIGTFIFLASWVLILGLLSRIALAKAFNKLTIQGG